MLQWYRKLIAPVWMFINVKSLSLDNSSLSTKVHLKDVCFKTSRRRRTNMVILSDIILRSKKLGLHECHLQLPQWQKHFSKLNLKFITKYLKSSSDKNIFQEVIVIVLSANDRWILTLGIIHCSIKS